MRRTKRIITIGIISISVLLSPVFAISQINASYRHYGNVLKTYVDDNGLVDYKGLKENIETLEKFIDSIKEVDVTLFNREEKLAFWMNAYNAHTLYRVAKAYPTKSIRFIDFGFVWKKGKRVAGGTYSLGDMEHKILRKIDPRIHFAINCASIGCPRLPKEPFYPETVDQQLEALAMEFINNREKVRLDREKNILFHSAIFKWFEEDFFVKDGGLLDYIKQYINDNDRAYLNANQVSLKTLKYDWGLNEQEKK